MVEGGGGWACSCSTMPVMSASYLLHHSAHMRASCVCEYASVCQYACMCHTRVSAYGLDDSMHSSAHVCVCECVCVCESVCVCECLCVREEGMSGGPQFPACRCTRVHTPSSHPGITSPQCMPPRVRLECSLMMDGVVPTHLPPRKQAVEGVELELQPPEQLARHHQGLSTVSQCVMSE